MENDILDSLNDIGYDGPLLEEVALIKAVEGGPKSIEYTKLVHTIADELKQLCNLEEYVNPIEDANDSSTFLLELSSFLKELGCPYSKLVTGHLSSRLQDKDDATLLLEYLLSELMAARMVNIDKPKSASMDIVMQESPTAKDLKDILIALKFNKPPPNITPQVLFSKLEGKLKDTIQKEGDTLVGKPLYNKSITEKQWKELETTFAELLEEYRLRREMLLTRLECTIQSFEWSERLKSKKDLIQAAYRPQRSQLKIKPDVKLSDFLAARSSLLLLEKTSNANVRKNTKSDVNKVIIGKVPDRGGRPQDQQAPPPEMPSWTKRDSNRSIGAGTAPRGQGGPGYQAGARGLKQAQHSLTISNNLREITRHSRFPREDTGTRAGTIRADITTVGITKVGITRVGITKVGITMVGITRVDITRGITEVDTIKVTMKVGTTKVTIRAMIIRPITTKGTKEVAITTIKAVITTIRQAITTIKEATITSKAAIGAAIRTNTTTETEEVDPTTIEGDGDS